MKKAIPINTTADGCAFTIVTRYEGRAYLKSMTGGVDITPAPGFWRLSRKVLNACADGTCKTIFTRLGRLSWENFLGRLEHGGWDCQMTSVLEVWTSEPSR